jgi:hypothetical protein
MMKFDGPMPCRRSGAPTYSDLHLRGKVHCYFDDVKMGSITGDNGRMYGFQKSGWDSPEIKPEAGMRTVFGLDVQQAVNIRIEDF